MSTTAVKNLPPGTRFVCPWNGRTGVVIEHSRGSTLVELHRHVTKTFTPRIGRNAGKEVTIEHSHERVPIAHSTEVRPDEGND